MKRDKTFASDNNSGVHPVVMEAIRKANSGHVVGYGNDPYTESAKKKFKEHLGDDIEVFFEYGGTGANVTALMHLTDSFNSIVCAETAHINTDECGAPEKFTGCKLMTIPTESGKITGADIDKTIRGKGDEHHSQERVVSITQATERGTVYTLGEIRDVAEATHKHNLILHMDGARICNAAASLGVSLKATTADVGVDVMSFGGTKNGLMYGEAVIYFDKNLTKDFKFYRKQGMQLASKMRFIAVQFETMLTDDLWLKCASHSNRMAKLLADKLAGIKEIEITRPVEANAVFAKVPGELIPDLQKEYFFYVFDDSVPIVRWMASYDTTEEDVNEFVEIIKKLVK